MLSFCTGMLTNKLTNGDDSITSLAQVIKSCALHSFVEHNNQAYSGEL